MCASDYVLVCFHHCSKQISLIMYTKNFQISVVCRHHIKASLVQCKAKGSHCALQKWLRQFHFQLQKESDISLCKIISVNRLFSLARGFISSIFKFIHIKFLMNPTDFMLYLFTAHTRKNISVFCDWLLDTEILCHSAKTSKDMNLNWTWSTISP